MKKLILLLICALALPLLAEDLNGKCIGVSDGDTITVLVDRTQVKVRLAGVDCPESHQDYGNKAKQFTSDLVFGKQVTVSVSDKDRYGRSVGTVSVGGADLNLSLVKAGLAWHYKAYSKDQALADAETRARNEKIGLWSQPSPTAPWDFRKGTKTVATTTTVKTEVAQPIEKIFWLNVSSNVRHNQSCRYYKNTKRGRACGKDEGKGCGICGG